MRQTIAQALIQEGRELGYAEAVIETKQEVLITLLQVKFKQIPQNLIEQIQAIRTIDRLDTLFRQSVSATRFEEIEIE